jgi:hypothetical protein
MMGAIRGTILRFCALLLSVGCAAQQCETDFEGALTSEALSIIADYDLPGMTVAMAGPDGAVASSDCELILHYGLGIAIRATGDRGTFDGYRGWIPGYLSSLQYYPETTSRLHSRPIRTSASLTATGLSSWTPRNASPLLSQGRAHEQV